MAPCLVAIDITPLICYFIIAEESKEHKGWRETVTICLFCIRVVTTYPCSVGGREGDVDLRQRRARILKEAASLLPETLCRTVSLVPAVLAPCGNAAADVAFRLVFVQHLFDVEVEAPVV